MTTNDANQMDRQYQLFHELVSATRQVRKTILESIGQQDPELKVELEKLLQSHDAPKQNLLNQTAGPLTLSDRVTLREGDMVGNYKILQLIGEGGMGQVYMAEQQEGIRRRVALKLMHFDRISKNSIARFDAEREALSRLDHPGIARILDAGQNENGQRFFVMELIKGISIIKFCDREKLSLKDRLELFEEVCRAIHHAHQKGIIHRDIKPSNILVTLQDGRPSIKVIDFGIAKGLGEPLGDKTMFTRFGELIGTPNYMSPEQVENGGVDLDIRSDIYSLGVLLHELVTGKLPFEFQPNRGLLKQLEELRDSEAIRPSLIVTQSVKMNAETVEELAANRRVTSGGLLRYLQGDLDWIILKVLSKTRSERYESAAAFGNDIRRFLNQEPVEAVAPSWTYKLRKVIQKHRAACVSACVGILSLVFLSLFSTYSAISSFNANSMLQKKTIQLEQEIERSKQLKSRAVTAERQANQLARQRQNEAVVTRATSAFFFDSLCRSPRSLAPMIVMSEWQKGASISESNESFVMIEEPVVMEMDSTELPAEIVDKIRDALNLDGILRPNMDNRSELKTEIKATTGIFNASIFSTGEEVDFEKVGPDELNRERLRLYHFVKAEQVKEFGEEDKFVGQSLLRIAQLHAKLGENTEAQLAIHQAMDILKDRSLLEKARSMLAELIEGRTVELGE